MSADKYPSIFSRQLKTIVYLARYSPSIRIIRLVQGPPGGLGVEFSGG